MNVPAWFASSGSFPSHFWPRFLLTFAALLCGPFAEAQNKGSEAVVQRSADWSGPQLPSGTILPLRLSHGFSSKNARVGQVISARVMQDVPLASGGKIPAGAKARGSILFVSPAGKQRPNTAGGKKSGVGKVSFRFDQIELHHQSLPIITNLRAIASFMEVQFAQIPETSPGFGTPYPWVTTDLIEGDVKYGVGGPVTDRGSQTVGEGTAQGVLVHVRARAGSPCRSDLGDAGRLQALWVFSSDACGVYGMDGVKIDHAGRTSPVGEIVLSSNSGDVNVRTGAGLLLRVR